MIIPRPAAARGVSDHGWLKARHSFSFGDYVDPHEMGWGVLRVINEDRIAPASGFGRHGHRDMEIITYLLDGVLEHKDSLGNGGLIRRGEVQRMSAGRGILHSEANPSPDSETHLLQIWIAPAVHGSTPSYEQQLLPPEEMRGRLRLVAGPEGTDGSTTIEQDAHLYASLLAAGETLDYRLAGGRLGYVQVISGRLAINGQVFSSGDGAKIADESQLDFRAEAATEFLLFDLPPLHMVE